MSASAQARAAYASQAVATASPARLLTMLYDRLVRDLLVAEKALVEADSAVANDNLIHAQQIVLELRTSLDTDAWEGAAGLAALYTFLHGELIGANVTKDVQRVVACRELVEPLRQAWHEAARLAAQGAA